MEVNVEIVLSYNDEETDWKVKKIIARFLYRLKKYRTGNRFSGEYTYKINQDSELYKQIIEFYKSNRKDVEFICLDYDVKVSDEEFEKDWHISDHRMLVVDIEEDDMRENDYKDTERRILCSVMERMFPDGGETYTIEEVKRLFEEECVHEINFEDALSKCIEEGWIIDCGNGNYTR